MQGNGSISTSSIQGLNLVTVVTRQIYFVYQLNALVTLQFGFPNVLTDPKSVPYLLYLIVPGARHFGTPTDVAFNLGGREGARFSCLECLTSTLKAVLYIIAAPSSLISPVG